MNFLERIFSVCPDGGSGVTEVLLLGVIGLGVLAWLTRTKAANYRLKRRSKAA